MSNSPPRIMKSHGSQNSIFVTLASIFLACLAWVIFAPTQLGGQVTYVIVDGNSMEPGFHLGDLVIVRANTAYQVGDVVTYKDAELGKYVYHRIVGTDLDRFILKGDHNSWLDPYHPTRDEIIGKLWIYIPKLGKAVQWLRLPLNMAIITALLGAILMSNLLLKPPKHKNEGHPRPFGNLGKTPEGALYLLGFLTLAFLVLGIFAFTRPATRAADNIQYQQDGYFFYSATGTPGVNDSDKVQSGEPVFPKLTCFLNVGFAYNIMGSQLQEVAGARQLYARVLDEHSGWQRTIPMESNTPFSGTSFFTVVPLDLCQVESMTALMEKETGLHQNTYTLEIIMDMAVSAKVAGMQTTDSFNPVLVFKFDEVHFYLDTASNNESPLHFSKQGLAGGSNLQANTISLFGLEIGIPTIRWFAILGLVLSVGGLILVGWSIYDEARQSQETLIRLRYGGMMVDVYEHNLQPTSTIIDVASIDDLAKLAERHGTMILHMTLNFLHYYLVQSNGTTYRYVISVGKRGITETEPDQGQAWWDDANADKNNEIEVKPEWEETRRDEARHVEPEPAHEEILQNATDISESKFAEINPVQEEVFQRERYPQPIYIPEAQPVEYEILTYEISIDENNVIRTEPSRKTRLNGTNS